MNYGDPRERVDIAPARIGPMKFYALGATAVSHFIALVNARFPESRGARLVVTRYWACPGRGGMHLYRDHHPNSVLAMVAEPPA